MTSSNQTASSQTASNRTAASLTRRDLLAASAAAIATTALLQPAHAADASEPAAATVPTLTRRPFAPARPGVDYTPVITPNGATLTFKLVDGIKVFHLIAEEVDHEFVPGLKAKCWGYNGRTIGPTIEAAEGDRVRVYVTNRLPEPTSVHWHGLLLPNGMDGVAGLTQPAIQPGETFKYEFDLRRPGTHMYHPHFDEMTQMGLGMMGMLIIHQRVPAEQRPHRDFALLLSEWRIDPGTSRPNPTEMTDFNVLTFNSKAFPATEPLVAKTGERVRIRFGNLGAMDHHPIHLHGYNFSITETDGCITPPSARTESNSILIAVGQTRAVDFVADAPGDWAMHCHMTHHVMNQMGHGTPNMVGVAAMPIDAAARPLLPGYMTMGATGMGNMPDMAMAVPPNSIPMIGGKGPFGSIDMGGMFTVLKVRDELTSYQDPGWYQHPAGDVAAKAAPAELQRDGITLAVTSAPATRAALYTCPMHPHIQSDQPGNCPICNMKLVPVKP